MSKKESICSGRVEKMSELISSFWIMMEIFFYQEFWGCFFQKSKGKQAYWLTLFISSFLAIVITFCGFPQPVYTILYLIFFTAICCFLYDGTIVQHAIVVLLGFCIASVLDTAAIYGGSLFLSISVSQFIQKKRYMLLSAHLRVCC